MNGIKYMKFFKLYMNLLCMKIEIVCIIEFLCYEIRILNQTKVNFRFITVTKIQDNNQTGKS